MAEIYFTTKALEDLVSIWDYTVSTWSERQAGKSFPNNCYIYSLIVKGMPVNATKEREI